MGAIVGDCMRKIAKDTDTCEDWVRIASDLLVQKFFDLQTVDSTRCMPVFPEKLKRTCCRRERGSIN